MRGKYFKLKVLAITSMTILVLSSFLEELTNEDENLLYITESSIILVMRSNFELFFKFILLVITPTLFPLFSSKFTSFSKYLSL